MINLNGIPHREYILRVMVGEFYYDGTMDHVCRLEV